MPRDRDRAASLLQHYLKTVWKAAGLQWNSDNDTEVDIILDAIEGMITDGVREHAENAPHLYPDGSTR